MTSTDIAVAILPAEAQHPPGSQQCDGEPSSEPQQQSRSQSQLESFFILQNYESDRRARASRELNSIVRNWNQCKDLFQTLADQVDRASRLANFALTTFQNHVETLQAIRDDCLLDDDARNVVAKPNRQQQRDARFQPDDKNNNLQSWQNKGSSFASLFSTVERLCQAAIAVQNGNKFAEVVNRLQHFRTESTKHARELEAIGDAIVQDLSRCESEIERVFDALEEMIANGMECPKEENRPSSNNRVANLLFAGSLTARLRQSKSPTFLALTDGKQTALGDWWLLESLYLSTVACAVPLWEDSRVKLTSLFQSLSVLEKDNNTTMNDLIAAGLPEYQQLVNLKEKSVFQPFVADFDKATVVKAYEEDIRETSGVFLKMDAKSRSSIMNRSVVYTDSSFANAPWLSSSATRDLSEKQSSFEKPLHSLIILHTNVMERWEDAENWVSVLSVLTKDRYLHVFDIPDVELRTQPQSAFDIFLKTNRVQKARRSHNKKLPLHHISPIPRSNLSFNLRQCSFVTMKYSLRSFDVVEGKANKYGESNRHAQRIKLRLASNKEAWVYLHMLKTGATEEQAKRRREEKLRSKGGNKKPNLMIVPKKKYPTVDIGKLAKFLEADDDEYVSDHFGEFEGRDVPEHHDDSGGCQAFHERPLLVAATEPETMPDDNTYSVGAVVDANAEMEAAVNGSAPVQAHDCAAELAAKYKVEAEATLKEENLPADEDSKIAQQILTGDDAKMAKDVGTEEELRKAEDAQGLEEQKQQDDATRLEAEKTFAQEANTDLLEVVMPPAEVAVADIALDVLEPDAIAPAVDAAPVLVEKKAAGDTDAAQLESERKVDKKRQKRLRYKQNKLAKLSELKEGGDSPFVEKRGVPDVNTENTTQSSQPTITLEDSSSTQTPAVPEPPKSTERAAAAVFEQYNSETEPKSPGMGTSSQDRDEVAENDVASKLTSDLVLVKPLPRLAGEPLAVCQANNPILIKEMGLTIAHPNEPCTTEVQPEPQPSASAGNAAELSSFEGNKSGTTKEPPNLREVPTVEVNDTLSDHLPAGDIAGARETPQTKQTKPVAIDLSAYFEEQGEPPDVVDREEVASDPGHYTSDETTEDAAAGREECVDLMSDLFDDVYFRHATDKSTQKAAAMQPEQQNGRHADLVGAAVYDWPAYIEKQGEAEDDDELAEVKSDPGYYVSDAPTGEEEQVDLMADLFDDIYFRYATDNSQAAVAAHEQLKEGRTVYMGVVHDESATEIVYEEATTDDPWEDGSRSSDSMVQALDASHKHKLRQYDSAATEMHDVDHLHRQYSQPGNGSPEADSIAHEVREASQSFTTTKVVKDEDERSDMSGGGEIQPAVHAAGNPMVHTHDTAHSMTKNKAYPDESRSSSVPLNPEAKQALPFAESPVGLDEQLISEACISGHSHRDKGYGEHGLEASTEFERAKSKHYFTDSKGLENEVQHIPCDDSDSDYSDPKWYRHKHDEQFIYL